MRPLSLLLALLLAACGPLVPAPPPTLTPWPSVVPALTPAPPPAPGLMLVLLPELALPKPDEATPHLARLAARSHAAPVVGESGPLVAGLVGAVPGAAALNVAGVGPESAALGVAAGGATVADGAIHQPALAPAQGWVESPPSFSPRLEARLPLRHGSLEVGAVWLLAIDSHDDGVTHYDSFLLDDDKQVGPESGRLRADLPDGTGQRATLRTGGLHTAWKLLDGEAATLRLAQSPARHAEVWPPAFAAALDATLGPPPPSPAATAAAPGWGDGTDLAWLAQQESLWLTDAVALAWQRERPPLLVVSLASGGDGPAADRALARLLPALDLSRQTLFVGAIAGPVGHWWAAGARLVPPTAAPPRGEPLTAAALQQTALHLLGLPLLPNGAVPLDEWMEVP